MAQTPDKIAKDIIVAWLSRSEVHWTFQNATEAGEAIGKVYTAVLQAVRDTAVPAASVTPEGESTPERRGRRRP
jgi:hypothetical protein